MENLKIQITNKKLYGRPDGLGNRYEELLLLSNYAVDNNLYFKYFWNNSESGSIQINSLLKILKL